MQMSRYDTHADWFFEYTRGWQPTSASFLPADLASASSRSRVRLGAAESGVVSTRSLGYRRRTRTPLVQRARSLEHHSPLGIRYLQGDVGTLEWWDGQAFDGVICNMALMHIDDLDAAFHTAHTVLRPAGWFNFSLLHPCFPGNAETDTLPSWPPDKGYATEGWWTTNSTGVRGHVGAHHRMLSTYLNAALRAGFQFTSFAEADNDRPRILIAKCAKP